MTSKKQAPKLYLLILTLQSFFMICVAAGPFVDGQLDFGLLPFAWHKTIGFVLNLAGFFFVAAAVLAMKTSFTIFVKPRQQGELVQSGVFSLCRNPVYFGGLLMCFGWSISFQSNVSLISALILVPVLFWKVSYEEVELQNLYGEAYSQYKSRTKKLVPFLF